MSFDIKNIESQKGRIAIVTGANIGLGFETTRALGEKGATVIMACRNQQKAEAARSEILKEFPQADLRFMALDLSKLSSVREFAQSFLKEFNQLDLLINNAGIMIPPYSKTEDGFESQLGTNYLSHFLLTGLLLEILEKTNSSRIVQLSSIAHKSGRLHFNDLQFEKKYSRTKAYGQSKLASLMFAYELNTKLKEKGYQTISVAAHPGFSATNLMQFIPKLFLTLSKPLMSVISQSPRAGAQPSLYAALGNDIQGGDYTGPDGFSEMKGNAVKVNGMPHSHDKTYSNKLWQVSEELTGANIFG